MEIREGAIGAITVLDIVGELVLAEGERHTVLKDTITRLMHEGRRQFMVTLAQVSRVDSSGLTSLVAAQITVRKHGIQMKLVNPTKRLRQLLGITKLTTFFEVFDTERDAIKSFAAQSEIQT